MVSSPGMCGALGRVPVLMKMCSLSSTSSPTWSCVRATKRATAAVRLQLRMLIDAALLAIAKTLHHVVLASHDRGQIDADVPGLARPIVPALRA